MTRPVASALALAILLIATPAILWQVYRVFAATGASDFGEVAKTAERISVEGKLRGTHFLFPALVIGTKKGVPSLSFLEATGAAVTGLWTVTAVLLFFAFREKLPERPPYAVFLVVPLVLSALFLGPFNVMTYAQKQLHAGYFNAFNFHNPSSNMLKPFALVLFLVFTRSLAQGRRASSWPFVTAIAIIHVVSLLSKPSFSVYFLPVVGLVSAYALLRNWPLDLRLVAGAYLLPFLVVSGVQYALTFTSAHVTVDQHYIAFDPFKVLLRTTPAHMILPKIVASILFPLVTLSVFFHEARGNRELLVGWIGFLVAAGYVCFLLEGVAGPEGWFAGNFGWSVQMATFLLFVASIRHVLGLSNSGTGRARARLDAAARLGAVALAFAANLAGGLLWYRVNLTQDSASWW